MGTLPEQTEPRLALFARHEQLVRSTFRGSFVSASGEAIVWRLVDGKDQEAEFRWLHHRAGAASLLVLPPASG